MTPLYAAPALVAASAVLAPLVAHVAHRAALRRREAARLRSWRGSDRGGHVTPRPRRRPPYDVDADPWPEWVDVTGNVVSFVVTPGRPVIVHGSTVLTEAEALTSYTRTARITAS